MSKKASSYVIMTCFTLMVTLGSVAAEIIELQLWDWHPPRVEVYEKAADEYMALNPHVKIEVQLHAWEGFFDKAMMAIVGGSPPEIMQFSNHKVSEFMGMLAEYPPQLFDVNELKEDYYYFEGSSLIDEKAYWLPIGWLGPLVFYDVRMWESAALCGSPKTWYEMADYGKKLVKQNSTGRLEVAGFSFARRPLDVWEDMNYQFGGTLYRVDGQGVAFNTQAGIEALDLFVEVMNTTISDMPGDPATGIDIGNAAMQYNWTWFRGMLDQQEDIDYGVFLLPTPTGNPLPAISRSNVEVSAVVPYTVEDRKKQASFDFLKWFMENDDLQIELSQALGAVPSRYELWGHPAIQQDPVLNTFVQQLPYAVFPGELTEWLAAILGSNLGFVVTGDFSPSQALDRAQQQGDAYFAGNPPYWIAEGYYSPPED